ncbi:uncharacterized protein EV420DRAFT_1644378 [Desarmillaria tabescens]|uniref:Peptidase C14 caspase domain-containing protein n=1 Tax=Armillaria tabescens TaxID=1929756 RepID=A0AA39K956_ARMTA|nr:uncharacterized protein EV420DRAFT_1644378 [Desarmillaria tabescens]KAK0455591.1 hypothetical protein EV420DRAFT_1644378 [Desarmillaria tabescens]
MSCEEIPSQSNLSSDTMQHIPDHQPQADIRTTAFDEVIPGRRDFAASVTQQSILRESPSLIQAVRSGLGLYRFWAVLIGVDAYAQVPLRGCKTVSSVSSAPNIQTLMIRDPKSTPSRTNIVDTLYSLVNNPEIERNDNIIIYYAGHGTSYYCEKHDLESQCDISCPIEALCPIDRDYQDSNGNWIPDISDRELNSLFTLISHAKGPNITFIADCCHRPTVVA